MVRQSRAPSYVIQWLARTLVSFHDWATFWRPWAARPSPPFAPFLFRRWVISRAGAKPGVGAVARAHRVVLAG